MNGWGISASETPHVEREHILQQGREHTKKIDKEKIYSLTSTELKGTIQKKLDEE